MKNSHTDWAARFMLCLILLNTVTTLFSRIVWGVCTAICFFMWMTDAK